MSDSKPVLELKKIVRRFTSGEETIEVLSEADLVLKKGEIVALVAPSGTGKSTLLHLAGLLEAPDEGEIMIEGLSTRQLGDKGRTILRRDEIGFVYQFHHLLGEFTACENVMLPLMTAGVSSRKARERAIDLLTRFGLEHRLESLPGRMSGGEKQRTAIARALANHPSILLADEPTGNLDVHTAELVFAELMRVVREEGVAALIATHNESLAAAMDHTVTLKSGKIIQTGFGVSD